MMSNEEDTVTRRVAPDVHSLGLRYLQVDDDDYSHLLPRPHDNAAERRTRIFSTGSKRVVPIIGESPIKSNH